MIMVIIWNENRVVYVKESFQKNSRDNCNHVSKIFKILHVLYKYLIFSKVGPKSYKLVWRKIYQQFLSKNSLVDQKSMFKQNLISFLKRWNILLLIKNGDLYESSKSLKFYNKNSKTFKECVRKDLNNFNLKI